MSWGDGTALDSTTPTIVANPNGTFSVQAHHTYAEESNPAVAGTNPYSILVTIHHDLAPNTTANDTANVSDPAVVVTQSGFALTPVEGRRRRHRDPGGLHRPWPRRATSSCSATVNWGDGTALDSSTPTIVANPNGTFSVQAHHTYAEESNPAVAGTNPYSILVTIHHDLALNTTANDSANVSDPAVIVTQSGFALTPVEGADTGIVTLAVFTDPGGAEATSDYSASVNWGDGTSLDSTTPTIVANANGTFSVQAHHTYAEESNPAVAGTNPYSILVTIHHDLAPNTTASGTANVSDPTVVVTQQAFSLVPVEGHDTGIVTLATFIDPGGAEATDDYTATIDWGDGSPLESTIPTIVANADGSFSVEANHIYKEESNPADPGSNPYGITVSISHGTAPTTMAYDMAVVSDPPVLVVQNNFAMHALEGQDTGKITLATFVDPGRASSVDSYTVSVAWGDGSKPDALTPMVVANPDGSFSVEAHHLYVEASLAALGSMIPFPIVVTIGHGTAPVATANDTAAVDDQPLTASLGSLTLTEGMEYSGAVASFY